MPVSHAAKVEIISRRIAEGTTPKQAILDAVGDLSKVEVLSDLVLIGTYIRSEKRASGLILPKETVCEDQYQSKVGLVLKKGPLAYTDWEDGEEVGQNAKVGSWVVFHVGDGWPIELNGTACRLVPYEKIRLRVADPTLIY